MAKDLSSNQKKVLAFIKWYIRKHPGSLAPTHKEISNHMEFKSITQARDVLIRLDSKGFISMGVGARRGITVL